MPMDGPTFDAELRRLAGAATALAAIGALLRMREEGGEYDPRVEQALTRVAEAALPGLLDKLDDQQAVAASRYITTQLSAAYDLLRSPGRGPGWAFPDPALLQAQGDISRAFPRHFAAMAGERPQFAAAFDGGHFLDIGVGVASLALEAAAQFPRLRVTGLDIWEPSLALARAHIAASPYADRVAVRAQDVTTIDETDAYTAIWFPILFFPRAVVEAALPRLAAALRPGGWLIIPRMGPPPEGLSAAIGALQLLRQGGAPWTDEALGDCVERSGFAEVAFAGGVRLYPLPESRLLLARKRPA
jgi:2-polyprenyl-3-methyl-5-hydroxy-6-metoxy-1,4-benzoquinol methylase